MKVTNKWLEEKGACSEGRAWFEAQKKREAVPLLRALMVDKKLQWANWLIVRVMDKPQRVRYAIFAAEQVIEIYEKRYPNDKRPRKAIEAAKAWVKRPTEKNRAAADAAAYAAYAAADAAAYAAYAAYAYAAYAAADAAAYAAADAAAAAYAYAAYAAADALRFKVLEYGIKLLQKGF